VKPSARKIVGGLLERLQRPKFYRIFAKKLMNTDIHCQIASPDDTASLCRFFNNDKLSGMESRIRDLGEQLAHPEQSGFWIIAKRKDRVVGGAYLLEFQESDDPYIGWWISGMKVNWRYRRLGIGEKLIKLAEGIAVRKKASEIRLLVFTDARPAYNLYRKMGFCRISIPVLDRQLDEEAHRTLRRQIILAKDIEPG
jgi:GNAT superfamily N-acetyltransferase